MPPEFTHHLASASHLSTDLVLYSIISTAPVLYSISTASVLHSIISTAPVQCYILFSCRIAPDPCRPDRTMPSGVYPHKSGTRGRLGSKILRNKPLVLLKNCRRQNLSLTPSSSVIVPCVYRQQILNHKEVFFCVPELLYKKVIYIQITQYTIWHEQYNTGRQ